VLIAMGVDIMEIKLKRYKEWLVLW